VLDLVLPVGLLILIVFTSVPEKSATQIFRWPGPMVFPLLFLILSLWVVAGLFRSSKSALPPVGWLCGISGLAIGALGSSYLGAAHPANLLGLATVLISVMVFAGVFLTVTRNPGVAGLFATGISWCGLSIVTVSLYRWGMGDVPMALGLMDPLNQLAGEELLKVSFAENRNTNPFGHPNYTAGAVLLFIPWHVRSFLRSGERWKLIWGIALLFDLICLISTFSRGAWLGLGGGGMLFVIWLRSRNVISKKALVQLMAGLAVVGALLLVANPRLLSSLVRLVTRGSTQTDQVRSTMAEAGWLMFKDNWLLGVGPGNVTAVYPEYRSKLAAGLEDNYQLHVTPLQIGVEQGGVGLVAWGMLIFAAWRTFRQDRRDDQSLAVTAFFCLLTYGMFSLTDHQLDVLPIVVLVFINLALLAAADARRIEVAAPMKTVIGSGVLLASAVFLLLLAPELRGRSIFHSAMSSLRDGRLELFEAQTVQAIETAPSPQYYANQMAAYHADRWLNLTNQADKAEQRAVARRWLERSLAENPSQEFCYFNLGWMLQDVEPLQSAASFVAAARLVPDRKGVFRGLALSLINAGETNAAPRVLALECFANPEFVVAAFWAHSGHGNLWTATYSHLTADLQLAIDEIPAGDSSRRVLEQRLATLIWLETGGLHEIRQREWSPAMQEFWATIETNDRAAVRGTGPKVAWKYLHDAWAEPAEREALVARAVILSTKQIPNSAVVDELVRWVSQENWADVVRGSPPEELFRAFGRQRSGFNLLARNMDGLKPTDACAYVDNHVIELFFEFVVGRKEQVSSIFVLKQLDKIVDSVPGLKDAVSGVREPVTRP